MDTVCLRADPGERMIKITIEIDGCEPVTLDSAEFSEVASTYRDHAAAMVATLGTALVDLATDQHLTESGR